MDARSVNLWNFGSGTSTATIDFGRGRPFLAWGSITFTDSLADYDRDNGSAIEVFEVDGARQGSFGSGGDHLGAAGSVTNLRPGAVRGFARTVTFRLRSFHVSDLEHYGVGCVLLLD